MQIKLLKIGSLVQFVNQNKPMGICVKRSKAKFEIFWLDDGTQTQYEITSYNRANFIFVC